jgi:hypothetical protein
VFIHAIRQCFAVGGEPDRAPGPRVRFKCVERRSTVAGNNYLPNLRITSVVNYLATFGQSSAIRSALNCTIIKYEALAFYTAFNFLVARERHEGRKSSDISSKPTVVSVKVVHAGDRTKT